MKHVQSFDLRPHPKERPRANRGVLYTPAKTRIFEGKVANMWDGPKFEGPVSLDVVFFDEHFTVTIEEIDWPRNRLRGDLDNYVKSVQDGLNKVAYTDDKQITFLSTWFQDPF